MGHNNCQSFSWTIHCLPTYWSQYWLQSRIGWRRSWWSLFILSFQLVRSICWGTRSSRKGLREEHSSVRLKKRWQMHFILGSWRQSSIPWPISHWSLLVITCWMASSTIQRNRKMVVKKSLRRFKLVASISFMEKEGSLFWWCEFKIKILVWNYSR